ncbi:transposase [Streptomyces sp. NBC_00846]|nr:transposase [Streptomyces sp. NBC_00846]
MASLSDATASDLPAKTAAVHSFAPDTLWTTRYIDAAVAHLRAEGHEIRDEDIARLSPLKHRNLNVLGRYSFTTSTPAGGALRPLRDPDTVELDEDDEG